MARSFLLVPLSLAAVCISSVFAGDAPPLSRDLQRQLTSEYPNDKVVNWCSGKFVGKETNAVAVLRVDSKREFLVVWVTPPGSIQELDSVPQADAASAFELQCLDAKQAEERQQILRNSEAITSSLKVLKGHGAVCYFTDNTTAKCWSLDRTSGRLIEVGGWQT